MLPGKTYTPEDVLAIVRKRIWLLLVPMAVATAIVALLAQRLPNVYRAETQVLVVAQRVPDTIVRNTVTTRIEDRLQTINPIIQSRTRLERIILDFDLYPNERRMWVMEDVVALMRRNIDVQVSRGDAFRITYTGSEPQKVRDVTNRLAGLYIDESLRDREALADSTDQFLESQLKDVERRLLEKERLLAEYRSRHAGELPSQFEANLQQLRNAQAQVQTAADTANRQQERRILVERQIAELEAAPSTEVPSMTTDAAGTQVEVGNTAQQLATAQALFADQETRFRPGHPDLEATRRRVAELQARLQSEMSAGGSTEVLPSPAEVARQRRLTQLRNDLAEIDRQIARSRDDQGRFEAAAQEAERRLEAVPMRESELVELSRDYSTLDALYKSLAARKEDARISANLERRQIGEQFQILDPAQLPERPISPNRQQIILVALMATLVIGVAIAGVLEYRDRGLHTEDDVASVLELPVLAVVPLMQTEAEKTRQRLRRLLLNVTCALVVIGGLATVVYTLVA